MATYDKIVFDLMNIKRGQLSDDDIGDERQLKNLVKDVSEYQHKLIDTFWPGPLTIIFDKKDEISEVISGGLSTIAIRMPSNEIAKELIELSGVPIAAPSANAIRGTRAAASTKPTNCFRFTFAFPS